MGNYDRADGGQLQRASCERAGGERGGGNVPSQIHRLMIELSSYVQPMLMYLFFQLSSSVLYCCTLCHTLDLVPQVPGVPGYQYQVSLITSGFFIRDFPSLLRSSLAKKITG